DVEEIITLEAVLFESGRPVLVVPPGTGLGDYDNIAIAWDGSLEASRAMHGAMPLLAAAGKVVVLAVGEDDRDPAPTEALTATLACHGIAATTRLIAQDGAIGVALLSGAVEAGCGLMVMGGYGHSRLREMVLGGVTRDVLAASALPVLIAH
ncbi:MAG: universal stress protein, partial [Alphaproteobacteria bacterium]